MSFVNEEVRSLTASLTLRKIRGAFSNVCGPGSSVGIETDYRLDGRGIEFQWG
jgi:hypothetical protein